MMDPWNPEQNILTHETERKPNRYAAHAMITVTVVLAIVWLLNELKVFHVSPVLMRTGTGISVLAAVIPFILSRNAQTSVHPATKYIIMCGAVVSTFFVSVLLNFHVTVVLLFPILIAMLYRSRRIGWFAVIGSAICTVFPPIVSYFAKTWDVPFIGLLYQLGSRAAVLLDTTAYTISTGTAIGYILLYIAMPRLFIVAGCGFIMFYVIRIGIENVRDQISIHNFSQRDTLTGLYNQNFYKTLLESDLGEGKVGVMFFDVNGLKSENDANGHEYGDLLLRRCAESIRRIMDEDTTGYRVGGDEFLALVRTEDEETLKKKVKEWRTALDMINMENGQQFGGIRCSMEVGTAFGDIRELSELVRQADAVMYEFKKNRKKK